MSDIKPIDNTQDTFNENFEINVNRILYDAVRHCKNYGLVSYVYMIWRRRIAKYSENKLYKNESVKKKSLLAYYNTQIDTHKRNFYEQDKWFSDVIISHDKNGEFVTWTGSSNIILTKSKPIHENYTKIPLGKYSIREEYGELFILKIHFLTEMEVVDFLDYQLKINFGNDIKQFKKYWNSLFYHCEKQNYLDIFNSKKEQVNEWIKEKTESTTTAPNLTQVNINTDNSTTIHNPSAQKDSSGTDTTNESEENKNSDLPLIFSNLNKIQFTHYTAFMYYYCNGIEINKKLISTAILSLYGKKYTKGNYHEKALNGYHYREGKANAEADRNAIKSFLKSSNNDDLVSKFDEYSNAYMKHRKTNKTPGKNK